jgi:hypothetical protein
MLLVIDKRRPVKKSPTFGSIKLCTLFCIKGSPELVLLKTVDKHHALNLSNGSFKQLGASCEVVELDGVLNVTKKG